MLQRRRKFLARGQPDVGRQDRAGCPHPGHRLIGILRGKDMLTMHDCNRPILPDTHRAYPARIQRLAQTLDVARRNWRAIQPPDAGEITHDAR